MIIAIKEKRPKIAKSSFIAPGSVLIGDITIGENAAIWYGAVIRADIAKVQIGDNTNIQDNSVVHVSRGFDTIIGNHVTIGHNSVIHACTIGNQCLIGMNSVVMDGAEIGEKTIIGAGSVVTKNARIPSEVMVLGSPAKVIRELSLEEIDGIQASADRNHKNALINEGMEIIES